MNRLSVAAVLLLGCAVWLGRPTPARPQTPPRNPQRTRAEAQAPPAQSKKRRGDDRTAKVPTTTVQLELLTGADASSLKSYEWSKVCEELKVACTIRRGRDDDEPGVTQKTRGESLRMVTAVGRLDRAGRLVFPDRAFTLADARRFGEWITELKTYGAQGTPEGQRVWGLSKEQFASVFGALAVPIEFETVDLTLGEFLDHLTFPASHPLTFTAGATQKLGDTGRSARCSQSVQGFAQGTALALVLGEQGLGFRPRRLPNGAVDLAVFDLAEAKHVWPVGWYRTKAPGDTAPTLFVFKEIHFVDIDAESALASSTAVTGVPVLLDRGSLAAKDIDLSSAEIDFPLKRTTWAQAYDRILGKQGCKYEILIDESGRPFVWVTTLQTPSRRPD